MARTILSGIACLAMLGLLVAAQSHGAFGRVLQTVVLVQTTSPTGGTCSDFRSPPDTVTGTSYRADLSATKNIAPNATGVAAPPLPPPLNAATGTYDLTVNEQQQKASWTLRLCDVPQYIASHLHVGSPNADYPPPLIPLEPYAKPTDPFAPPEWLPQLCPAVTVVGCAESRGSFTAADISPLPGREPAGDLQVPTVNNWADFLEALNAGNIYINIHSLAQPANLIRGNLFPTASTPSSPTASSPVPSSG